MSKRKEDSGGAYIVAHAIPFDSYEEAVSYASEVATNNGETVAIARVVAYAKPIPVEIKIVEAV